MADQGGDRTERPTARKIKEARERGQIARSRDLSMALSLATAGLTLSWIGSHWFSIISGRMISSLSMVGDHARRTVDATDIVSMLWSDAGILVALVGPPAILGALVSVTASTVQTGWAYSPKVIQFNWERLSPATGFGKFAPIQALPELAKSVIGMAVMTSVAYAVIWSFFWQAPVLMQMTPAAVASAGWDRLSTLLWRSSLALLALGAADYGVQRWRWFSGLKMTRQEVRDESKLHEGSPEMKARVRKVQRQMTRRRMLSAVKTATVVVTNPTHVAVALEYRRHEMAAPRVVAKGQDELAARIRQVAREHGVPIIENVVLARALHKSVAVGDTIPASLFGAVAEVLAYLVRIKHLMF